MNWRAYAREEPFAFGAVLYLAKVGDGKVQQVTDLTFTEYQHGVVPTENSPIEGPEAIEFMQAVMDAAYEYGLRPSKMQDERHLQNHLKDMQEITRHILKMSK